MNPTWFNNEHDRFPGEYFCYILMSYDIATDVTTIHDVVYSHKPLDLS